MSRKRFVRARGSKKRKLLSGLSRQVQQLISKSLLQAKFDQSVLTEIHKTTFAIRNFEEQLGLDVSGSTKVSKEDAALRSLLNQVEERIELIAQYRAEDIVNRRNH